MQKPSIPKGTRDFGPLQMLRRKYLMNIMEGVFRKYGFMPLETPAMENLDTLTGKYGDEGDQLLFRVLNSGDFLKDVELKEEISYRSLSNQIAEKGLRYDLTVPFARYVVMNRNDITFPFKRYQMQAVWRADRPQRGRFREFYQCDADVVGSNSLLHEAELVMIYDEVFSKLGIEVEIIINNRKILQSIAEYAGVSDKITDVTVVIDKLDKVGWDGVVTEWQSRGISEVGIGKLKEIFSFSGNVNETLTFLQNTIGFTESGKKGLDELQIVFSFLKSVALQNKLKLDLTLARGLSYYTGCIFEVKANHVNMGSIGGGGRYDDLTGIFGMPGVSGVGISFGLDRIYEVVTELNRFPEDDEQFTRVLICCFDQAAIEFSWPILLQLRQKEIVAEMFPEAAKMKKQLSYADAKQIPYAIIIGETEMQTGNLVLKDLKTGEQQSTNLANIINTLQKV